MYHLKVITMFIIFTTVLSGCESWSEWTTQKQEEHERKLFKQNVKLIDGNLGSIEEALTYFYRQAKEENRFGSLCQYYLAVCYYKLNDLSSAERSFNYYLEISPDGEKIEEAKAYLEKIHITLETSQRPWLNN